MLRSDWPTQEAARRVSPEPLVILTPEVRTLAIATIARGRCGSLRLLFRTQFHLKVTIGPLKLSEISAVGIHYRVSRTGSTL